MDANLLTILNIIALGLFAGTGLGLLFGYLLKTQKKDFTDMTRREILINAGLVAACSLLCGGGLFWYAFLYGR